MIVRNCLAIWPLARFLFIQGHNPRFHFVVFCPRLYRKSGRWMHLLDIIEAAVFRLQAEIDGRLQSFLQEDRQGSHQFSIKLPAEQFSERVFTPCNNWPDASQQSHSLSG